MAGVSPRLVLGRFAHVANDVAISRKNIKTKRNKWKSIKVVLKLRRHWLIEYKSDQHVLYKNLASFIVWQVDIVTDLHISSKYNIQVAFVTV